MRRKHVDENGFDIDYLIRESMRPASNRGPDPKIRMLRSDISWIKSLVKLTGRKKKK